MPSSLTCNLHLLTHHLVLLLMATAPFAAKGRAETQVLALGSTLDAHVGLAWLVETLS